MTIDKKRQKKQQAGRASGDVRSSANAPRDANVKRAYKYLRGFWQTPMENIFAREFLDQHGVDLNKVDNPYETLAKCISKTEKTVRNIVEDVEVEFGNPIRDDWPLIKTIGTRLKDAREMYGYSISRAAKILGISVVALESYERGETPIPLKLIRDSSDAYCVPIDVLFGLREIESENDHDIQLMRYLEAGLTRRIMNETAVSIIEQRVNDVKQFLVAEFPDLVKAVIEVKAAESRFRELNPAADVNMRGLNTLINKTDTALKVASNLTRWFVRKGALPISALDILNEE